jgi:hypothetical protein
MLMKTLVPVMAGLDPAICPKHTGNRLPGTA